MADASGNMYVAGYFTGALTLSSITLTSAGNNDVFVAKWNTARAQRAGGTGDDQPRGLCLAGTGVYIVGDFTSPTFSFGSLALTNSGAATTSDVFVAKFEDAGASATYAWAQRAGSSAREFGNAIAVSGTSVYISGWFTGATASFGNLTAPNLGPVGYPDVFVAQLTEAGSSTSFTWVQRAGGAGDDVGVALAVNGSNVYVAGHFDGPSITFGNIALTNVGNTNVFVTKLTDAGNTSSFTWTQAVGGAAPPKSTPWPRVGVTSILPAGFLLRSLLDLATAR
jgi:hypothetical protein